MNYELSLVNCWLPIMKIIMVLHILLIYLKFQKVRQFSPFTFP